MKMEGDGLSLFVIISISIDRLIIDKSILVTLSLSITKLADKGCQYDFK